MSGAQGLGMGQRIFALASDSRVNSVHLDDSDLLARSLDYRVNLGASS